MPSGLAAFNSATPAATSSALPSAASGFALYLIRVRFIAVSLVPRYDHRLSGQGRLARPKGFGRAKNTSGVERDDAEVALHAERHARRVSGVGEDRHDVVADLARRHRRPETGEEGFDTDAPAARVSLGRGAPKLGVADDLLPNDRLEADTEIEPRGRTVGVDHQQPQHPVGARLACGQRRAVQRPP